ncbi:iron complex outermembrane recepter protein [Bradyrhizobium sp. Rc3b]|uniref:TonB-dependent receptor domain-containing protein n=1 Tax=unclassified Bradyrhizobium TaxID=2631580 RepID=UPI0008E8E781|nr:MULTISPECIES: TonB-dependent receptor [unclassified Bradyrhizobium]MBB4377847.1 iron complex outermembrane receptor protein [Bradyrhizobium sp. SBR1B]SFN01481.1 iron complex outermembrane recepter protein [Bradyrhizobium sp. Rc3b]
MSRLVSAARRLAVGLLVSVSFHSLDLSSAFAQHALAEQLPPIEVTQPDDHNRTRARAIGDGEATRQRARTNVAPAGNGAGSSGSGGKAAVGNGAIVGAATTVITAADIAHSPSQTLAEIIATQTPGAQITTLYGGQIGAKTSVDLRGFGAFATANTLVLVNGRRLNDVDMAQVDLSTIPLNSIERIEVTRGNSGAVLYGDNAVGGVINIVTRNGVGGPPVTARIEAGFGSFNTRLGNVSTSLNSGPWSTSFYGNTVRTDGYRDNNRYSQQNGVGNLNYTTPSLSAFLTVTGDNQELRLPGGRTVDPSIGLDELRANRRGTSTPFNYANQEGFGATAGFTKTLVNGVDLIVDGGVRDKKQQSAFFSTPTPVPAFFTSTYVGSHLTNWSITPRLSVKSLLLGMPSQLLTGIDYYDASFEQNRGAGQGLSPWHNYDLRQQSVAGYFQHTLGIAPTTDISYGARVQNVRLAARDNFDPAAPFNADIGALPLTSNETQYALHLGAEHRLNDQVSLFGRVARAFRTPDVDERLSSGPSFDPLTFAAIPQTFELKTQTSWDIEGGFRIKGGGLQLQSSLYLMDLTNEVHFNPVLFYNTNLDPTRRYGSETSLSYRVNDALLLRSGVAYTRAVFREGIWAGNDVPLVSRYTASAGVTWNIWQNYVVLDATARFWSERRMDNDQAGTQKPIPANGTIDLKLSGQVERYFWSVSINNVLNALYYDYAIASTFTDGRFSAYPLPGRTYLLKAGATF